MKAVHLHTSQLLMLFYAPRWTTREFYTAALHQTSILHSARLHCQSNTLLRGLRSFSSTCTAIEECWSADSWSVNPTNNTGIDTILQRLNSPAPQSFYVIQRSLTMSSQPTIETLEQCSYLLKAGHRFWCNNNAIASKSTPGDDWMILSHCSEVQFKGSWANVTHDCSKHNNTKLLVNKLLDLLVEASETQALIDQPSIEEIYSAVRNRLELTLGTDLRGRSAADTAFLLALTGCQDEELFQMLAQVARLELQRGHQRSSRPTKDILHVAEKLVAAGIRGNEVDGAYQLVAQMLNARHAFPNVAKELSSSGLFGMFSSRPLLWLWRFTSRLRKPTVLRQADNTVAIQCRSEQGLEFAFVDDSRPLVIDLGCGLGVSLIGLASVTDHMERGQAAEKLPLDWTRCNFLGCDLNQLLTRYGSGISSRWGLCDRLQYASLSVEDLLEKVKKEYSGPVALIMIQFPTPFRASTRKGGNQQLPSSTESGFMISATVMKQVSSLLRPGGMLLVQSNCEDVAIHLRDLATSCGLEAIPSSDAVSEPRDSYERPTKRTVDWIAAGGDRAAGIAWASTSLLPHRCATETEIACQEQQTPIHRILLRAR